MRAADIGRPPPAERRDVAEKAGESMDSPSIEVVVEGPITAVCFGTPPIRMRIAAGC